MTREELVHVNGVDFYVQVADEGGPRTVGLDQALSFDGVRDTISAIATQVGEACQQVSPDEASIEFGLSLTAKAGKLTGLLVEGSGAASLKVTLSWRKSDASDAGRNGD
ncbi:MAG: CU044_2847 family protein [Actinomadura sp.]